MPQFTADDREKLIAKKYGEMKKKKLETNISIVWDMADVLSANLDMIENGWLKKEHLLTAEEIRDVLSLLLDKHDATCGITWETIEYYIVDVIEDREK